MVATKSKATTPKTKAHTQDFNGMVLEGKAAPDRERVIEDLEQLKVTFDPVRSKILRFLSDETLAIKDLAIRLGVSPNRLYHHMGVLEERGFIESVGTRTAGKNLERIYGLTASRFRYSKAIADTPNLGRSNLAIAEMQDWVRDIAQALTDQEEGVFGEAGRDYEGLTLRVSTQFSLARAREFIKELRELTTRYVGEQKSQGQTYTFVAVFTPTEPE